MATAFLTPAATTWAGDNEIPFSVANVFLELNDTDGDLGIHALIDGQRQQGLTELFFESAEPPFDELPPETFFRRFPEGEYEVEGMALDVALAGASNALNQVAAGVQLGPIPRDTAPDRFSVELDGGKITVRAHVGSRQ